MCRRSPNLSRLPSREDLSFQPKPRQKQAIDLIASEVAKDNAVEYDLTGSGSIDIYAFCRLHAFIDGTLVTCLANSKISLKLARLHAC